MAEPTTKPKFLDYYREAFHARPWGMFISPNWLFLGLAGLAGLFLNPGFWLMGAGAELFYLHLVGNNVRFQKYIQGVYALRGKASRQEKLNRLLSLLPDSEKGKFFDLDRLCNTIIEFYSSSLEITPESLDHYRANLENLEGIFLQLLITRQTILKIIPQEKQPGMRKNKIELEIQDLEKRMKEAHSEEIRMTQTKKLEILKERLVTLGEASEKLAYIDEELDRILQQAELIREKAAVSKDSQTLSVQTDMVAGIVNGAADWIKRQQNLFGGSISANPLESAVPVSASKMMTENA